MENSNGSEPAETVLDAVTLALYVRSPVAGTRTVTIDRLHDLESQGAIETFDVEVIPEQIIVSQGGGNTTGGLTADFGSLLEWEHDEFEAAFDLHETSSRMGRPISKLRVPEMSLGIYQGGELTCVFPCTDGERTWTVSDFLDRFESGTELPPGVDTVLTPN